MKKILLAVISVLFVSCASQTVRREKIKSPFLYLAQKGQAQVYLFGTYHGDIQLSEVPDIVLRSLDQAEIAFFEISFNDVEDEIKTAMEKSAKSPLQLLYLDDSEPDLDKQMSPENWRKLREHFGAIPEKSFKRMSPDYILITLMADGYQKLTAAEKRQLGRRNRDYESLDLTLKNYAASRGKTIGALESATEQMQLLRCTSVDSKVENALEFVENPRASLNQTSELETTYRSGDEGRIHALLHEAFDPQERVCILTARNRKWADQVESYLKAYDQIFLGIGVGHLVGPGSLVEILVQQGFQVRRL